MAISAPQYTVLSRDPSPGKSREHNRIDALIEHALVLLADVERRYECDKSIIEGVLHPQPWKDWRLEQLEYRRFCERQPIVQQLCLLHHRRTMAAINFTFTDGNSGSPHSPPSATSTSERATYHERLATDHHVRQIPIRSFSQRCYSS
jgi:hypothetical protein